jgi:hypothetical protein
MWRYQLFCRRCKVKSPDVPESDDLNWVYAKTFHQQQALFMKKVGDVCILLRRREI